MTTLGHTAARTSVLRTHSRCTIMLVSGSDEMRLRLSFALGQFILAENHRDARASLHKPRTSPIRLVQVSLGTERLRSRCTFVIYSLTLHLCTKCFRSQFMLSVPPTSTSTDMSPIRKSADRSRWRRIPQECPGLCRFRPATREPFLRSSDPEDDNEIGKRPD